MPHYRNMSDGEKAAVITAGTEAIFCVILLAILFGKSRRNYNLLKEIEGSRVSVTETAKNLKTNEDNNSVSLPSSSVSSIIGGYGGVFKRTFTGYLYGNLHIGNCDGTSWKEDKNTGAATKTVGQHIITAKDYRGCTGNSDKDSPNMYVFNPVEPPEEKQIPLFSINAILYTSIAFISAILISNIITIVTLFSYKKKYS